MNLKNKHPLDILYMIKEMKNELLKEIENKKIKYETPFGWKKEKEILFYTWANWSRELNKNVRKFIKETEKEDEFNKKMNKLYKVVYSYWWDCCHLIMIKLPFKITFIKKQKIKKYIKTIEEKERTIIKLSKEK